MKLKPKNTTEENYEDRLQRLAASSMFGALTGVCLLASGAMQSNNPRNYVPLDSHVVREYAHLLDISERLESPHPGVISYDGQYYGIIAREKSHQDLLDRVQEQIEGDISRLENNPEVLNYMSDVEELKKGGIKRFLVGSFITGLSLLGYFGFYNLNDKKFKKEELLEEN